MKVLSFLVSCDQCDYKATYREHLFNMEGCWDFSIVRIRSYLSRHNGFLKQIKTPNLFASLADKSSLDNGQLGHTGQSTKIGCTGWGMMLASVIRNVDTELRAPGDPNLIIPGLDPASRHAPAPHVTTSWRGMLTTDDNTRIQLKLRNCLLIVVQ